MKKLKGQLQIASEDGSNGDRKIELNSRCRCEAQSGCDAERVFDRQSSRVEKR